MENILSTIVYVCTCMSGTYIYDFYSVRAYECVITKYARVQLCPHQAVCSANVGIIFVKDRSI